MNKKQFAEWRDFARVVSTLNETQDGVRFPLRAVHDDKPDFKVTFEGGTLGVEMTEFVDEERRRGESYHREDAKTGGVNSIVVSNLYDRPGGKRSKEEVEKSMFGRQAEWPTPSEMATRAVAKIAEAVEAKLGKMKGFERFNRNWLVLSNPDPIFEDAYNMNPLVNGLLSEVRKGTFSEAFDRYYLLYGQSIFMIQSAQVFHRRLPVGFENANDQVTNGEGLVLCVRIEPGML